MHGGPVVNWLPEMCIWYKHRNVSIIFLGYIEKMPFAKSKPLTIVPDKRQSSQLFLFRRQTVLISANISDL